MCQPLSREDLLAFGRCCGGRCVNCPYEPQYSKGSTKIAEPPCVCYVCAGTLIEIRGKHICSRCHVINETCCDGGQCR
jgi:hypothetical protein